MKAAVDACFHCPLFVPSPHDEWDADASLQLINAEAQRFLERISVESDAAKKMNSEITAALGLITETKVEEAKSVEEMRQAMEATSQDLKGRVSMLAQMCLSLHESVQSLREALVDTAVNAPQCKAYLAPAFSCSLPERTSAPAGLQLKHDFSSSSRSSSRNDAPGSQMAQAATVRVAGSESEERRTWSGAGMVYGANHAQLQNKWIGRGAVSINRQLTVSTTAMCNETPATRRPPVKQSSTSALLGALDRNTGITSRRATYHGHDGGSLLDAAAEEHKGEMNGNAGHGRTDKMPATQRPPLTRSMTSSSLGGRRSLIERSTGFSARRATYQGGGNLLNDAAEEELMGEVHNTAHVGLADSKVPARRPPPRRNTTSASLGRRLEEKRAMQFRPRRATYQGPEGGRSILDDIVEEENEEPAQDLIAKQSLLSTLHQLKRTGSARTENPISWAAASSRVF